MLRRLQNNSNHSNHALTYISQVNLKKKLSCIYYLKRNTHFIKFKRHFQTLPWFKMVRSKIRKNITGSAVVFLFYFYVLGFTSVLIPNGSC